MLFEHQINWPLVCTSTLMPFQRIFAASDIYFFYTIVKPSNNFMRFQFIDQSHTHVYRRRREIAILTAINHSMFLNELFLSIDERVYLFFYENNFSIFNATNFFLRIFVNFHKLTCKPSSVFKSLSYKYFFNVLSQYSIIKSFKKK